MNVSGTKSGPNAERRNADVHDAILAAAGKLVRRYGYNRVSIEAVAAAAGAGKQTIYRWWPTKAALFLELYLSLVSEQKLKVGRGSMTAEMRAVLRRVIRIFATTPANSILVGLVADASHDRSVAKALTEHLLRRRRYLFRGILERGRARGEIRRGADLDLAVDTISGAIWQRLILAHAPLDQNFVERLIAQVLKGVVAR